jgi:hypothetical protein
MERVMKHRRVTTAAMRKLIVDKHNNTCAMCSISGDEVPLELASITPLYQGGDISENNYLLLCPNCHRYMDMGPREIEFVNFLYQVLRESKLFGNVQLEAIIGDSRRARADIFIEKDRVQEKILIECKSNRAITRSHSSKIVEQILEYGKLVGKCRLVLAIPGRLPAEIRQSIEANGIEIWDADYICENFGSQIKKADNSHFKMLLSAVAGSKFESREDNLLKQLKACKPGRQECYIYQSLIGVIIEELFCPPLEKPIQENSDFTKSNRRDFIVPNYANDGFWAFIREKYLADYIVADAKNYTRKVKKTDILQIANYLKTHGAGLFGIIFSRNGGDSSGCLHTIREQWMVHQKLILVLDDTDVENMLISAGGAADVIGAKIEEFRLSM